MPTGQHWATKTHCPQGHAYDAENTRINKAGSRECRACGRNRAAAAYRRDPAAGVAKQRAWQAKNPAKVAAIERRRVLRRYGLTPAQYDEMLVKQGGGCAICGGAATRGGKSSLLSVDHDHKSGLVRGLLCSHCNFAIGLFADDPVLLGRAIEYLKQP